MRHRRRLPARLRGGKICEMDGRAQPDSAKPMSRTRSGWRKVLKQGRAEASEGGSPALIAP
jgi:hypothetical protein